MTPVVPDDYTPLDARVLQLWRRRGLLCAVAPTAIAAAAVVVIVVLAKGPILFAAFIAVVATAVVVTLTIWLPPRWYSRWSYKLDNAALEIRHGTIIRRRSVVPYFRVQHVDTSIGPLERSLGLARLKVHTASSGTDAEIPGLAEATAAELRAQIVARAGLSDGV